MRVGEREVILGLLSTFSFYSRVYEEASLAIGRLVGAMKGGVCEPYFHHLKHIFETTSKTFSSLCESGSRNFKVEIPDQSPERYLGSLIFRALTSINRAVEDVSESHPPSKSAALMIASSTISLNKLVSLSLTMLTTLLGEMDEEWFLWTRLVVEMVKEELAAQTKALEKVRDIIRVKWEDYEEV
ncbi:MAG: hypothetical protein DRK00_10755 [Thermoprotei archaeon]|nr:MAG: hypothetical protein DRK00_10755 [Thermoprotei archaeon]